MQCSAGSCEEHNVWQAEAEVFSQPASLELCPHIPSSFSLPCPISRRKSDWSVAVLCDWSIRMQPSLSGADFSCAGSFLGGKGQVFAGQDKTER